ncbi:MAG: hypothetical protein M1828_002873 [Chrysothrix sp. TS-e1954]|nr:MAG: hypothetical protein M1828_002873 [Chrysothrix sp. TS-e1954]
MRGNKRLSPFEPLQIKTRAASKTASLTASPRTHSIRSEQSHSDSSSVGPKASIRDDEYDRPIKRTRLSHEDDEDADAQLLLDSLRETRETSYGRDSLVERPPSSIDQGRATMQQDRIEDATPSIESSNLDFSHRLRAKPKRPKGWHLRKANRHLYQRSAKDTPENIDQDFAQSRSPSRNEPGAILKRLPGRRRAPHSDDSIEADLRRQLELKVAYRAVVKGLKPVLAELVDRTVHSLEDDHHAHEQYDEYNTIATELDCRLQRRLEVLEEQSRLEKELLSNELDVERDVIAQHILSLIRDMEKAQDDEATDEEYGLVPPLYNQNHAEHVRQPLASKFDSRSRLYVEVEGLWKDMQTRHTLCKEQQELDTAITDAPKGFAVFDGERRRCALAAFNLLQLHTACQQLEAQGFVTKEPLRRATSPFPHGLQALAEASELVPAAPSVAASLNPDTSTFQSSQNAAKPEAAPAKKPKPAKPYYETFSFTDTFPGIVTGPLTPSEKRQIAARRRRTGRTNMMAVPVSSFAPHPALNVTHSDQSPHTVPGTRGVNSPLGPLSQPRNRSFGGHGSSALGAAQLYGTVPGDTIEQASEVREGPPVRSPRKQLSSRGGLGSNAVLPSDPLAGPTTGSNVRPSHPHGPSTNAMGPPMNTAPFTREIGGPPRPYLSDHNRPSEYQRSEPTIGGQSTHRSEGQSLRTPGINSDAPLPERAELTGTKENQIAHQASHVDPRWTDPRHGPLARALSPLRSRSAAHNLVQPSSHHNSAPTPMQTPQPSSRPSLRAQHSYSQMHPQQRPYAEQIPKSPLSGHSRPMTPSGILPGRHSSLNVAERGHMDGRQYQLYQRPSPFPSEEQSRHGPQATEYEPHLASRYQPLYQQPPHSAPAPLALNPQHPASPRRHFHPETQPTAVSQSLRRHPGQRIGHQLLPADMAPDRPQQTSPFRQPQPLTHSPYSYMGGNAGRRGSDSGRSFTSSQGEIPRLYPQAHASAPLQPLSQSQWPGFEARSHGPQFQGHQDLHGFPSYSSHYEGQGPANQGYGQSVHPTEVARAKGGEPVRPWERRRHSSPPAQ